MTGYRITGERNKYITCYHLSVVERSLKTVLYLTKTLWKRLVKCLNEFVRFNQSYNI